MANFLLVEVCPRNGYSPQCNICPTVHAQSGNQHHLQHRSSVIRYADLLQLQVCSINFYFHDKSYWILENHLLDKAWNFLFFLKKKKKDPREIASQANGESISTQEDKKKHEIRLSGWCGAELIIVISCHLLWYWFHYSSDLKNCRRKVFFAKDSEKGREKQQRLLL